MIYDRMLASQFAKERLLDSKKLEEKTKNVPLLEDKTTVSSKYTEPENESGTSAYISQSKRRDLIKDHTDPLYILKVRFARGEINKEQYEEMQIAITLFMIIYIMTIKKLS
jgi:hypothetical protein